MHPACRSIATASIVLFATITARGNDYPALHLYQWVEKSDVIVVGRIIDAERAIAMVERVLKGHPGGQIRLVQFIDPHAGNDQRRPLVRGNRELMFLRPAPGGYAPLQTQGGRWPIGRDGRFENRNDSRTLNDTINTVRRIHDLQREIGRGPDTADRAYTTALRSSDPDVRLWALQRVPHAVQQPSSQLLDAYLPLWRSDDAEAWGSIANAVIYWRLGSAAQWLHETLITSDDYRQRAVAARALGGAGDRAYVSALRRSAASDASPHVRASAYGGLTHLLGPESLPDLKTGATDADEVVRSHVAVHAANMARRADNADVSSAVTALLESLQADPSPHVSSQARSMLSYVKRLK